MQVKQYSISAMQFYNKVLTVFSELHSLIIRRQNYRNRAAIVKAIISRKEYRIYLIYYYNAVDYVDGQISEYINIWSSYGPIDAGCIVFFQPARLTTETLSLSYYSTHCT